MKTAVEDLYKRVESQIDQLNEGQIKHFETPEYSPSELMAIPEIVQDLKDNKYKDTISFRAISLRTVVTKINKNEKVSTSPFENLVFEKSEDEIKAEQSHKACLEKNHKLVETNKTTFKTPILICEQCKLGYIYKLGKKGFSKVVKVSI